MKNSTLSVLSLTTMLIGMGVCLCSFLLMSAPFITDVEQALVEQGFPWLPSAGLLAFSASLLLVPGGILALFSICLWLVLVLKPGQQRALTCEVQLDELREFTLQTYYIYLDQMVTLNDADLPLTYMRTHTTRVMTLLDPTRQEKLQKDLQAAGLEDIVWSENK